MLAPQAVFYFLQNAMAKTIISWSSIKCAQAEKQVLSELNHPLALWFFGETQDDKNTLFVTDALVGGNIFEILHEESCLSED